MSGLRRVSPPWRIISVCVIAVSSPPEIPAACESGVRIDEVLADPAPGIEGDANGDGTRHTYEDEFVEILNLGPDQVDLSGWRLGDDDTSIPSWFKFPAASLLAPGARALVFGGGAPTGFAAAAFVDDGRLGNGLSNGGDVLFLIDAAGDTIDSAVSAEWPADQSIVRSRQNCDEFLPHADPPGRGDCFSPGTPRAVLDSVSIEPADTTVEIGARVSIRSILYWSDGGNDSTTLNGISTDTAVLQVDLAGQIQALSQGTAGVRSEFGGRTSTEAQIQVVQPTIPQPPANLKVVINEVLADPPAGSPGDANGDGVRHSYEDEFVELFNAGADTVSLAGWRLGDDDQPPDEMFEFPAGAILPPAAHLVVFGGGGSTGSKVWYAANGRIGNGLTNGGDRVLLFSAFGDTVDSMFHTDWGNDQSVVRWPEGKGPFLGHSSPPGKGELFSPGEPRTVLERVLTKLPRAVRAGERHAAELRARFSDGNEEVIVGAGDWSMSDTTIAATIGDSICFKRPGSVVVWVRYLEVESEVETTVVSPPPNRPPVFVSDPDTTARENLLYRYTVDIADPDGDPLDLQLREGPPWLGLNDRLLSGRAEGRGKATVSLDLSDGIHWVEQRFSLRVAPLPDLVVTELLADPPSGNSGDANGDGTSDRFEDEFVEIHNRGASVDLSSWRLSDDDTAVSRQFVFPQGTVLRTGEYLVLFGGGQPRSVPGKVFVDDGKLGNGLTNSGDRVLLLSGAEADTIISLEYSSRANIDQSLLRRHDRYVPHTQLPGRGLFSPGTARNEYDRFSLDILDIAVGDEPRALALWGHSEEGSVKIDPSLPHWLFREDGIAQVNAAGLVEPLRAGTARIEAWVRSNYLTIGRVRVRPPPDPPNLKPIVLSTPDSTAYSGGHYRYPVRAEDPEHNSLNFTFVKAPDWLELHHATGLMTGKVPSAARTEEVAFQVTDGRGGLEVQEYKLRILPRPRVLISEILADPPTGMGGDVNRNGRRETYGDEFVELHNFGTIPLRLAGLHLKDARSRSNRAFSFPDWSVLPAGGRVAVFGSGNFENGVFFSAQGRIGGGLGNRADSVFVIDPEGPDTLARQSYDLRQDPGQSLCWDPGNKTPFLHSLLPGRDRHSPGLPRPVLRFARLVPGHLRLIADTAARLQVVGRYSDGMDQAIVDEAVWVSSDASVVAVTNDGDLTAVAPGIVEIRARVDTFEVRSSHVTVKRPLTQQLTFSPTWSKQAIPEGRVVLLNVRFSGEDRPTYGWKRNGGRLQETGARLAYSWSGAGEDTVEVEVGLFHERVRRRWVLFANRAPTITAADSVVIVGRLFALQLVGVDADGDALAYTLESGPQGLALNQRTGRISWRPTVSDLGSHELKINVSDGFNSTLSSFTLSVHRPAAKLSATSPDPHLVAWPNPFSAAVNLAIRGATTTVPVDAGLFDLAGQKLRTLRFDHLSAATPVAVWNGTNDRGAQVGSGVYLAVVEYNGRQLVRKLLCLR